jgi:chemotaxis protein methyltransferase CheR
MSEAPKLFDYDSSKSDHHRLQSDKAGFTLLASLLKEQSGIYMPATEKNLSLMALRLGSVLKKNNLKGYGDLNHAIQKGNQKLLVAMVEALTTNKTDFFRERQHMDLLTQLLPKILEENRHLGQRELRVWCAAASTGQEPYTLAITLKEAIANISQWSIKFLATDIDTKVLKKAANGIYSQTEMEGLSSIQRQNFFKTLDKDGEKKFAVRSELKSMIRFAPFNLMTEPFPFDHKFDVIFCRNVLIYFDRETAGEVVARLANALRPGGYLFLGHTETGVIRPSQLTSVAVAAYRKT